MNQQYRLQFVTWTAGILTACGASQQTVATKAPAIPTWKTNAVTLEVDAFLLRGGQPQPVEVGGTGVFLDGSGTLVTNNHVMRRCRKILARFEDGRSTAVDGILALSPDSDVAVLRAKGVSNLQDVPITTREQVEKGQEILAVGNVLNLGLSVMPGYLNNITSVRGQEFLVVSVDLAQGASGGPVFDKQGRLVGIMRGFMRAGGGKQSLVIPAWRVAEVVNQGMQGDPCPCDSCANCCSPDAFRCRYRVLEERELSLEPGESVGFMLAAEEDRDYSLKIRVKRGSIRLADEQGSEVQIAEGETQEAVFTSTENTVGKGSFSNDGDSTAEFSVTWGRIEW